MTLNDYIFKVIEHFSIEYTFGIPGDFALPLYASQEKSKVKGIICTHEPNAVFAADAYSRVRGLSVVLTTYGAGALNMVNPVAMAYAEQSPLVIISGAPEQELKENNRAVHHLVRDYGTQIRIFNEICVECLSVENLKTVAQKIYNIFKTAVREQRPVYIEVPRNLMNSEIPNIEILQAEQPFEKLSEVESLKEASREIIKIVSQKKSPVIIAGIGVRRYELVEELIKWSENCSIPVVTSVLGKASFPEDHPNFRGVFMGSVGDSIASNLVEHSDCIIPIGMIHSDVNTGFWTGEFANECSIAIGLTQTRVSNHYYKNVHIADLVKELARDKNCCQRELAASTKKEELRQLDSRPEVVSPEEITQGLNALDLRNYQVLCDIGDAWFIGLGLKANSFMAPGYYASMGFAVPGALGAGLANKTKRNLVLVGDGAFQMTGNEIASLQKHQIPTTVVLINNKSYKMLETFDEHRDYYDLYNWDYVKFSQALHCQAEQVTCLEDLKTQLKLAEDTPGVSLLEVIVDKDQHPAIMSKIRDFLKH